MLEKRRSRATHGSQLEEEYKMKMRSIFCLGYVNRLRNRSSETVPESAGVVPHLPYLITYHGFRITVIA